MSPNAPSHSHDALLIGIQGSGKGTNGLKLVEEFGYQSVEGGAIVREICASKDDERAQLREEVNFYVNRGDLVPSEIMNKIIEGRISSTPMAERLLFDGIPRTVEQKKVFDRVMDQCERTVKAIHLVLSDEVAEERMIERARKSAKPRADDLNPEARKRRIKAFHEETEPVAEAFDKDGNLVVIDASQKEEDVYAEVLDALGLKARATMMEAMEQWNRVSASEAISA